MTGARRCSRCVASRAHPVYMLRVLSKRLSTGKNRRIGGPPTIKILTANPATAAPWVKAARGYRLAETTARDMILTIWNVMNQKLEHTASIVNAFVDPVDEIESDRSTGIARGMVITPAVDNLRNCLSPYMVATERYVLSSGSYCKREGGQRSHPIIRVYQSNIYIHSLFLGLMPKFSLLSSVKSQFSTCVWWM